MITLEIDITDVEDLKIAKNKTMLDEIKETANTVLNSGGRVVIKRSYINASDDIQTECGVVANFEKIWGEITY